MKNAKRISITVCVCLAVLVGAVIYFSSVKHTGNQYREVVWNIDVNFTAGDCDSANYSGWCPHNLQYDKTRGKFVFLQCHRNGHMGDFSKMTLCYLDPADPLNYEELNCPYYVGLGALLVKDDGTWYIWTESKRYTSTDAGKTWTEADLNTPVPTRYGVYDIDGTLYMGDDSGEAGIYRISKDDGLTWKTESFDIGYTDCEASFCKFQGHIYAFLRTNSTEYACILKRTIDGWECVSNDDLLAGNSNCSPVAFDDYIAIAHVNRWDGHLYYTLWDGTDNFETTDFGAIEATTDSAFDFHSPSLAFGNGYACVAFMMHTYGTSNTGSYAYAQNNWIIGAYDNSKELFTCELKNKFTREQIAEDPDILIHSLSGRYPEDAVYSSSLVNIRRIQNNNDYGISLYDSVDNLQGCAMSSYDGFVLPVRNGKLIAYGTEAIQEDLSNITTDYIRKYQPYCNLEYHGSNYMCVKDTRDMMLSLQRKNSIYESTAVTDCLITSDVTSICYIPPHTAVEATGQLQYATVNKVSCRDLQKSRAN